MIVGTGIDIVELDRIARSYERFGERFLKKVLTEEELLILPERNRVPFLAARFAGKEAASKALGIGFRRGVSLTTLSIPALPSGKPELRFLGPALEVSRELGVVRAHVSLTHGRDSAVAVVVLES